MSSKKRNKSACPVRAYRDERNRVMLQTPHGQESFRRAKQIIAETMVGDGLWSEQQRNDYLERAEFEISQSIARSLKH